MSPRRSPAQRELALGNIKTILQRRADKENLTPDQNGPSGEASHSPLHRRSSQSPHPDPTRSSSPTAVDEVDQPPKTSSGQLEATKSNLHNTQRREKRLRIANAKLQRELDEEQCRGARDLQDLHARINTLEAQNKELQDTLSQSRINTALIENERAEMLEQLTTLQREVVWRAGDAEARVQQARTEADDAITALYFAKEEVRSLAGRLVVAEENTREATERVLSVTQKAEELQVESAWMIEHARRREARGREDVLRAEQHLAVRTAEVELDAEERIRTAREHASADAQTTAGAVARHASAVTSGNPPPGQIGAM